MINAFLSMYMLDMCMLVCMGECMYLYKYAFVYSINVIIHPCLFVHKSVHMLHVWLSACIYLYLKVCILIRTPVYTGGMHSGGGGYRATQNYFGDYGYVIYSRESTVWEDVVWNKIA